MSAPQETNPTAVSAMTNQVGDVMGCWLGTEPAGVERTHVDGARKGCRRRNMV